MTLIDRFFQYQAQERKSRQSAEQGGFDRIIDRVVDLQLQAQKDMNSCDINFRNAADVGTLIAMTDASTKRHLELEPDSTVAQGARKDFLDLVARRNDEDNNRKLV